MSGKCDSNLAGVPSSANLGIGHTGNRTNSFDANDGYRNLVQPSCTVADLSAGTSIAGFDIGCSIRNLTDERGRLGLYTPFIQVGEPAQVSYIRPQTIGLTVSKAFRRQTGNPG
jgi:hypothetical protein